MFTLASWAKVTHLSKLPTHKALSFGFFIPTRVSCIIRKPVLCLPLLLLLDNLGSFLYASLVALATASVVLLLILVLSPLLYDLTLLADRVLLLILPPVVSRALYGSGLACHSPSVNSCGTEQNCLQKTLSSPTVSLSENLIKT